jgi:hypothetical protein
VPQRRIVIPDTLADGGAAGAMGQPKLILDTNVPSTLQRNYRCDLERFMSFITEKFKIVALPTTFGELLDRLQGGDGSHFASDKEAFKVIGGGEVIDFLPPPGAFALRMLLDLDSPMTGLGPADFETAASCLFHAKSREDLFGRRVQAPGVGRCGINPQVIRQKHEEGRALHRRWLEPIRDSAAAARMPHARVPQDSVHVDGSSPFPDPPTWATGYAKVLGQSLNEEQASRFAIGLDAVYEYSKELCSIVTSNPSYNFDTHRGDWIDLQQLHYLCDPDIHLLSDDRDLRKRVRNSRQGDRILDLREFLTQYGFTPEG